MLTHYSHRSPYTPFAPPFPPPPPTHPPPHRVQVLLTHHGLAKIADFGLSRFFQQAISHPYPYPYSYPYP